jgi:hypothetical protein
LYTLNTYQTFIIVIAFKYSSLSLSNSFINTFIVDYDMDLNISNAQVESIINELGLQKVSDSLIGYVGEGIHI